jgi:hypothetical protein
VKFSHGIFPCSKPVSTHSRPAVTRCRQNRPHFLDNIYLPLHLVDRRPVTLRGQSLKVCPPVQCPHIIIILRRSLPGTQCRVHFSLRLLHYLSTHSQRPSIDEVNLSCRGSLDGFRRHRSTAVDCVDTSLQLTRDPKGL